MYDGIIASRSQGRASPFLLVDTAGALVGTFNAMVAAPHVGGPHADLGQHCAIEAISRIGSRAADPHRTARSNSDFEWQSHSGIARNLDIAGDVLASIDGGADPLTLTDSIERAVVAGTARLLEGSELDTHRQHDHLGEACGSTVPRW